MTHSHVPNADSKKYSGPSQAELGSPADWVSTTEFSQLRHGARPTWAPSTTAPAPQPLHHRRSERYSGPTRQELGDLGDWLDTPISSRPKESITDLHPASSMRAIESELWVSQTCAGANRSDPEPVRAATSVPERHEADLFLVQLDEIQASLQRRPRA